MVRKWIGIVINTITDLILLPFVVVHESIHAIAAVLLGVKITGFVFGMNSVEKIPEGKFFAVKYPWEEGYEFGASIHICSEGKVKDFARVVCRSVAVSLAPTIVFFLVLSIPTYLLYMEKPILSLFDILLLAVVTIATGWDDLKKAYMLLMDLKAGPDIIEKKQIALVVNNTPALSLF